MALDEDSETFEHPSYVMVGISRIQGGVGRLFGSALPNHNMAMRLRVTPAVREHSLSRDWYHAKCLAPIIEVDLSPAQFAEMITSMNIGSGVPATLRRHNEERIENPPDDHKLENEKVREGFAKKAKDVSRAAAESEAKVKALLDKKTISKADREEILGVFAKFRMEVGSSMPFILESFEEATEKVVTTAKAEIDAFVTHSVVAEGLRAIAGKAAERTPELPAHPVPDGEHD